MAHPEPDNAPATFSDVSSVRSTWHDGLLVLMYHAIETPSLFHKLQHLYVAPRKLRAQVSELKASGAQFIRANEVNQPSSRGRRVLITLDDGFCNVFKNAMPIFLEFNVPAITYIVAGQIGGSNVWDHNKRLQRQPLMSRTEIMEWLAAGLEIGAHTVNHERLSSLPEAQARMEIFDSKKILEDLTGRPIVHFCYPYGGWNPLVRDLVQEAGFQTACTCDVGYNTPETPPLELRRLIAAHEKPYAAAFRGLFS